MNRRISLIVLLLVLVGVVLSHLSWTNADNGPLLLVDGRPVDALGGLSNRWTAWSTRCDLVKRLSPDDAHYIQAKEQIKNYSPPSSEFLSIASVWALSDWILVEVEFKELLPSLVVLQRTQGEWAILPRAVWSGYTKPWKAGPFLRHYIGKQVPELPSELSGCFVPQSQSFQ